LNGRDAMKKQRVTAAFVALVLGFMTMTASAGEIGISVEFSDKEISVISAYYRDHSTTYSQQGNGKKGNGNSKGQKSLPPGIAMNLQRGKSLPPGIAKQVLPSDLIDLLPAPHRGFERIEVDGKILLVEIATQIIYDVLEDLILH
jgi:Ni/Co efflux regulator RcnB